jgi:hypothetical protein
MSLLDKIKAMFSGGSAAGDEHAGHDHSHEEGSSFLQSPTHPDAPVLEPTPEEIAAAAQAEPPTTVVEGLSEDDPPNPVH